MKKLIASLLALLLVFTVLAGCTNKAAKTDWEYVKDNGELKIGITYFAPMNYKDSSGKLVGFETEFAEEVCKELGITPSFIEIDWGSKEVELKAKNIDVIWNGMTWTEERAKNMLLSDKYINNSAVLVVKKGVTFNPETDSLAVEKGSQAENMVAEDSYFDTAEVIKVDSVSKSFLEVKSGNVDATYVDYVAALGMLGDEGDYADLEIWDEKQFPADHFALGFRTEDTELCQKVNDILAKMKADGRFRALAEKYGMGDIAE
jgi:polar amino acid transport system substrate-binding protein